MKNLIKYAKGYRGECVLAPLFKLFEAILELFVPLVVKSMIDSGIYAGDRKYIVHMCLLLLALGAAGLIASVTAQFFAAKAAVGITAKIRRALFSHLQKLSFTSLDRLGTSAMITRMTGDMNQVQNGINMALRLLLRSPFIVFGAMIMAFTIDLRSAMIFVAAITVLIIVVMSIMLITIPLYKKSGSDLDGVTQTVRENLTGVRVIRAFCREDAERKKFTQRNNALTKSQNFVGRIASLMNPLTYVIINAAICVLLYTGALQIKGGALTQGAVIALYNYMSQILVELIKMASLIITINRAVACAGRIGGVLDMAEGMDEPYEGDIEEGDAEVAVEFRNVSMKYSTGGDYALENVSFAVTPGETVGIIGGTGSGKSTLVSLIPRYYDVTDGAVLVKGKDVRAYDTSELRRAVGMTMQRSVLFRGTLRKNLKWGNEDATDGELYAALDTAQAGFAGDKGGLDMMIEQRGRNLSGGQRQRISIARTLAMKPEILILDDSSSALDYATDAALRSSLRRLGDITVFIVSQRTSSICHADKIIVMDDGHVAGIGTHDELLESCDVYKEIYYSQNKAESSVNGGENDE